MNRADSGNRNSCSEVKPTAVTPPQDPENPDDVFSWLIYRRYADTRNIIA